MAHYICIIIDRLREQLSLRVVVWNSVICIDHSRSHKARPPTNHTTPEGPVQPCGPVRFSVAVYESSLPHDTWATSELFTNLIPESEELKSSGIRLSMRCCWEVYCVIDQRKQVHKKY